MKAAVYRGMRDVQIQDWPAPAPAPGEVLIRIGAAGICGSDAAEFSLGPQLITQDESGHVDPVVLGHEFAGTIEAIGEGVTGFEIGARVVCGAGISCGECLMCRRGRTNLCSKYHTVGLHRDGGLAGFVAVPASIVYDATASGLPLDTLALAQPMAVAVHAVGRSGLTAGRDAVVVGVGGIGAFITYAAVATGARVLVVDLDPARLELATTLGAFATLTAGEATLSDRLAELGMHAEVFFEVSGSAPGLDSVLAAAQPGAVIVPVGIQKRPPTEPLGKWTLREYTIVGTVALTFATDLPEAVRLLGLRPDWTDFTREVIPLESLVDDGLEPLVAGHSRQIKTLVDPWISAPRPPVHHS
ncbi:zinc-dependent alcohol dehydrogenase [Lacisediminihabitans profunda]|uniref:Alcohol dehydrogenase catalytic domain-containing protein n=1 Tax=Lacisediminihabitans profunda TaxID=2594790 RepID=A0A5C8UM23_9MICO|nr:alcohol dehydrogenase catalytic domain-containing protein [Lacisediminihabitans profunda]TXN29373.1 alcohol dehydrogenase catalytic domain-containing protein [Lacisediminihabitans profunda]